MASSLRAAGQAAAGRRTLAQAGDTVWVVINHVKADKRAQFERFVTEIFWPMAAKLGPADQRTFRQTRVLNPVRPEADGTYSYFFVMDPVITGANYDILTLLKKMYGNEKAAAYFKQFTESLSGKHQMFVTVQSRY
ncbi:hypothetical protein [Hymenobacter sedentarius]|nr:hypothetical protein [Hymenobacter sedentarius]